MSSRDQNETISARVRRREREALDQVAAAQGKSRSQLLQEAVREKLQRETRG